MLKTRNDTIKLNQLSSIVKMPSLEALVLDSDYTITSNLEVPATVVSGTELLMDSAYDVEIGDTLSLNVDGFYFKHIIDNMDSTSTKILLTDDILDKSNDLVDPATVIAVKRTTNITVKLNDLAEGHYLIKPTNQKLVVRESYVQPYVSLAEISVKLIDATNLKQSRIDRLNKVALRMIYSDLSGFDNYYDIIDEVDLWKILFVKMECLLAVDYESKQEWYNPCESYEKLINSYMPKQRFEENADGTSSSVIINDIEVGGYGL